MQQVTTTQTRAISTRDETEILDDAVHQMWLQNCSLYVFVEQSIYPSNEVKHAIDLAEKQLTSDEYMAAVKQAARASEKATERDLRTELSLLVAAYPNAARSDLSAYGALLLKDVAAQQPSSYALATACKQLRRSKKFIPSVAEVLEAITEAERTLKSHNFHIARLPIAVAKARAILTEYERIETRKKG